MDEPDTLLKKPLLENALHWFLPHFRQNLLNPIESQFPNRPHTRDIRDILRRIDAIIRAIQEWQGDSIPLTRLFEKLSSEDPKLLPLFKHIILIYRRQWAAYTQSLTDKTLHPELTESLEEDVKALDALTGAELFSRIEHLRFPRLKDFLPVQSLYEKAVFPKLLA